MPCLRIKVSAEPIRVNARITQFCGAGLDFEPLLVDEGYLLIDFRGGYSKLFVRRR
jgi:hypothetical protein